MKSFAIPFGKPSGFVRSRRWGWTISMFAVLALLLQTGLPLTGMRVVQASGGATGSFTHNTAADFGQVCAVLSGTTVTNNNLDGEVRLLPSLEDHFNGTEVNASLWNAGVIPPDSWPVLPTVSGGILTLDGNYVQSTAQFNQSPRFMEARVMLQPTANPPASLDIGFYRDMPPSPPSAPGAPVTDATAMRMFYNPSPGANDLYTLLADGTTDFIQTDITDPTATAWNVFRVEWGAVNTTYRINGSEVLTQAEQLSGGDTLIARVLLYHMNPSIWDPLVSPMQVDWVRAGQYPTSGTYTSCAYDAGGIVNFTGLNWDATVPSGSGLTIQTQTSLNGTTWTALTSPINMASGSSANVTTGTSGRYFRYVLNFTSSDRINTAELRQLTVNFFGPNSVTVTPASPTVNPGATQDFNATVTDANAREVTGVTLNWSSTLGTINTSGLLTVPLPQAAGTFNNAVTASVNILPSGTVSGSTSVIVPNLPPTADAGGLYTGNEGSPIFLSGSGGDPNGGTPTFDWDLDLDGQYDDATGASPSNIWPDNGSFTVGLRVTSGAQTATDTAAVTVNNVNPTASFDAPATVNEGSFVDLTFSSMSDPSPDDAANLTFAYDCNTGSFGPASSNPVGTCATNDNGTFNVRGRIFDNDGGFSTYSDTVNVVNVPPTAAAFTVSDDSVFPGAVVVLTLVAPYTDPSPVDALSLEFAFDCGSGSYGAYSSSNNTSCTFTDPGSYTVRGRIKDKDGGSTEYNGTVTVGNVLYLPLIMKAP